MAEVASGRYWGFEDHPFPGCFVCGVDRPAGDGLAIFAGPIDDDLSIVAAPWTPTSDLAADGVVLAPFVWAALDCPSGFAIMRPGGPPCVLGRYAVELIAPVRAGEPHVVVGWATGVDGRRRFSASALLDAEGKLCAASAGTWIELRT
jgi:hypothetical protein